MNVSLLVGIFLFGCVVTSMVATGLVFAASAFEAGSGGVFEGRGLAEEEATSTSAKRAGSGVDDYPPHPRQL